MKKLLSLSILSLSMLVGVSVAEAKSVSAESAGSETVQTWRNQQRRMNRPVRTVTRTRIVRVGYRTYRETIQTRVLPNGRRITRVVSRVRIR